MDQPSPSGRRPREGWDDDPSARRDRRGGEQYARGDRSGRNPRPPVRDDWEASARPRGARNQSPADSGARGRRPGAAVPARGGLWGDESVKIGANPRGRPDLRDPRRGAAEEDEDTSPAAAFGKAVMAIILALMIGAGLAYGYYVYSTPKLSTNNAQPAQPAGASSGAIAAPFASHEASTGVVVFITGGADRPA